MRGLALALLCAAPLLRASDVCDGQILSEGIMMMDELECVTDVKACLRTGMCANAGISTARICECYRQVAATVRDAARRGPLSD